MSRVTANSCEPNRDSRNLWTLYVLVKRTGRNCKLRKNHSGHRYMRTAIRVSARQYDGKKCTAPWKFEKGDLVKFHGEISPSSAYRHTDTYFHVPFPLIKKRRDSRFKSGIKIWEFFSFFFAFLKFTFTLSLSSFFFLFRFLHIVIRLTKKWSLIYLDQFIFNGYKKQIIVNLRLIRFILHFVLFRNIFACYKIWHWNA